ncbi:hypothetical protein LY58_02216 [Salegentibacter salegens]|nr:hypothetical protein LY58_02216 [Salegentibacter salegens]
MLYILPKTFILIDGIIFGLSTVRPNWDLIFRISKFLFSEIIYTTLPFTAKVWCKFE